jgi:hypothetical protein
MVEVNKMSESIASLRAKRGNPVMRALALDCFVAQKRFRLLAMTGEYNG